MKGCPVSIGLLLSDDLTWISRVSSTAHALGHKVKSVRSIAKLVELAEKETPVCVILDLDVDAIDPDEVVERLRAVSPNIRFLAFGAHVDVPALQKARTAGFDAVLTRGQMAAGMHVLLTESLAPPNGE